MSTSQELRQVTKERIDRLSPGQLKVAAEFLQYLQERAGEEATAELLKVPSLLADLKRAEKDRKAGKGKNWREVRKEST